MQQSDSKYTIEYPFGNIRIKIPPARNVQSKLVFWSLSWLAVLLVSGYFLISLIFEPKRNLPLENKILMFVLFVVILVRVYPALIILVRNTLGVEVLEISPLTIKITSKIAGIPFSKVYDAERIDCIRLIIPKSKSFSFFKWGFGSFHVQATGPIALEHNGKEIYLGFGLDLTDGDAVVNAIHRRLEKYKGRDAVPGTIVGVRMGKAFKVCLESGEEVVAGLDAVAFLKRYGYGFEGILGNIKRGSTVDVVPGRRPRIVGIDQTAIESGD